MQLFFRKYGTSGPPLLILHGLYGASDNWITIARALAENFQVYALDQRNHGQSPHSDSHSYSDLKQDLLEFMQDEGLEEAIILGHSMGGKVVMQFALDYPEMVRALIVIDIAPVSYKEMTLDSHLASNHKRMMDAMLELDLSIYESRDEVSRGLSTRIGSDRIRMFLLKNLTRNKQKGFKWKINLPVLRTNLEQIMDWTYENPHTLENPHKNYPVLFIKGEKSDYIKLQDQDLIRKYFPNAEILSIAGSGHWVHAEQASLLIKNISYFLEGK